MKRMNSTVPRLGQPVGSWSSAIGVRGLLARGGRLVGRQAARRAVAVLRVVEALERARALGQVLDAGEALLAEETLVECVVEALDGAVAPRLAGWDEHGRGALAQAHARDLAESGRRHERPAVVELGPPRHAVAAPHRAERYEHSFIAAVLHDLDPGVMGRDVDLVERVEAHAAVEVARADQVDLNHVASLPRTWRRVWNPFRLAPAWTLTLGRARARDDPLDRPLRRRHRAELLKLPRDRRRTDLRPRVLLQELAYLQHLPHDPGVRAPGDTRRRTRAPLSPPRIARVIPRRPLRDPLTRPTQIPRDHPRRLTRQPAPRRFMTQLDLNPIHARSLRSINTSARASTQARMETMCWRLNPQPGKRCAGGYR